MYGLRDNGWLLNGALCGRVLTVERGRLRRWGHRRDNGMLLGDSSGLILLRPADYGGKWLRTFYQSLVPGVLCGDDRLQAQSRFVRAHSSCCCCTKDRSRILCIERRIPRLA